MDATQWLDTNSAVRVGYRLEDQVCFLYLEGKFTKEAIRHLTPTFEPIFSQHTFAHVILNLGKISRIDSSGIGFLVTTYHFFHEKKVRFVLCQLSEKVAQLIELIELDRVIRVEKDEAHALRYLEEYGD